jgi:hypothetical protein
MFDIGCVRNNSYVITVGTGWTEVYEDTSDGTTQVQVRTGSTSTTVGWDDMCSSRTFGRGVAGAIKAAAVGGGNVGRLIGGKLVGGLPVRPVL